MNRRRCGQWAAQLALWLAMCAGMLSAHGESRSDDSTVGPDNPYPHSTVIKSVSFDVAHLQRTAPGSDLWPVTWSDDGELYTSWGDGGGFGGTDSDGRVEVGIAKITGTGDHWTGFNILGGKNPATSASLFPGKSNGILSIRGILYLHVIEQGKWWRAKIGRSSDHGRTWRFNEGDFSTNVWDFSEPDGAFSDMTFLNFGKDYTRVRDEFVYVYSQDHRRRPDGTMAEITDSVGLFRVPKNRVMEHNAYEYFAGLSSKGAIWTQDIRKRVAVFSYPEKVGFAVRVDYNPGLQRYLLTTFHRWDGSWGLYDAPEPWGPWTSVETFNQWIDPTPKFGFTFPQKWMSPDGKTMFMVFSGTGIYDSFNVVKATVTAKGPRS